MRTILFPTDFSINALHAVRYGLSLFTGQDVRYVLVNAYIDPSVGASMSLIWEEEMKKLSETNLDSFVEKVRESLGSNSSFTPKCLSTYGDLPGALDRIISDEQVDLIIMGSSGAGSASNAIFGNTAYATMKHASCPVMTIPLQASIKQPKQIALASIEPMASNDAILEPLLTLVTRLDAKLCGISVHTDSPETESRNENSSAMAIPYHHFVASSPLEGIERAIGALNLDFLTIVLKKRGWLDELFHSPVSKKLAEHAAIPLLTLREATEMS